MDLCNDDNELDYEEDNEDLEVQRKNPGEEEISESINLAECDDQYLQIDLAEEEEYFSQKSSDAFAGSISADIQNIGKVNEKSKNSNQQNVPLKEQTNINPSKNNGVKIKNLKEKKPLGTFQYWPHFRKNKAEVLGISSRIHERRRDFKQPALNYTQNDTFGSGHQLVGVENCETKKENSCLKTQCNFLQDDEKELLRLKKEARLKRFMQDGSVASKKKLDNSNSEKELRSVTHVSVGHFGDNEKFTLREQQKENSYTDTDQGILPEEKPIINKELLLKKRNPFDEATARSEVKQENENKLERDCFIDSKLFNSASVQRRMKKEGANILPCFDSALRGFHTKDVKFVRTVSKSFSELAQRPGHSSPHSSCVKTLPFVESSGKNDSLRTDPAQIIESQLTGCIVKVLNIPPSATVDDVLSLCSTVGMVMEMKLNIPKENSVVIRFSEATCAEKFFTFYHVWLETKGVGIKGEKFGRYQNTDCECGFSPGRTKKFSKVNEDNFPQRLLHSEQKSHPIPDYLPFSGKQKFC